jgi:predicted helicase
MSKDKLAQVFHFDLYGKREEKYNFLNNNSLESISWKELDLDKPNYFFVEKDFSNSEVYNKGFKIDELFLQSSGGIQTKRDKLFLDQDQNILKNRIFKLLNDGFGQEFKTIYNVENSSSYLLLDKIKKVKFNQNFIRKISYFPFDSPNIYYDKELIGRSFYNNMCNFLDGKNHGLVIPKQNKETTGGFITNKIIGQKLFSGYEINYAFPLYLYPETNAQLSIGESQTRVPNLNLEIVNKIAESLGLKFTPENASTPLSVTNNTNDPVSLSGVEDHNANQAPSLLDKAREASFCPIDILDYIYAVLHSPAYREKYKEFLKIDFPRVPYPKVSPNLSKGEARKCFFDLVDLGRQLRELHLLESPEVENYITQYPIDGDNVVVKPIYMSLRGTKQSEIKEPQTENLQMTAISEEEELKHGSSALTNRLPQPDEKIGLRNDAENLGKVYINETQYFDNVPEKAWNFYIGGYQPAQKWLKDRKGRELGFEDILHYQKMIVALTRTGELMMEIDKVLEV